MTGCGRPQVVGLVSRQWLTGGKLAGLKALHSPAMSRVRSLSYVVTWTGLAAPLPGVAGSVYGTKIIDSKMVAVAYVRYAVRRTLTLLQSTLRSSGYADAVVYDIGRTKARALEAVRRAVGDTVKEYGYISPTGRAIGASDTRPITDFYAMIDPVPVCAFAASAKREIQRKMLISMKNAMYYASHGALDHAAPSSPLDEVPVDPAIAVTAAAARLAAVIAAGDLDDALES